MQAIQTKKITGREFMQRFREETRDIPARRVRMDSGIYNRAWDTREYVYFCREKEASTLVRRNLESGAMEAVSFKPALTEEDMNEGRWPESPEMFF